MGVAWRILKPLHVSDAFDGEGARLYGGRWNSKGTPLVYVSGSLSLAGLELLVHLESHEVLWNYICISVRFDEALVETLDPGALPSDWTADPAPSSTKSIGDAWVAGQSSVLLEVPSVIIPAESNFLINPSHRDFSKLSIGPPQPFEFDPRLLKRYG
ncbi:MAG: RES family NAD+ phosphorylase [Kiritimatiellae bacterium]|nr:RES family NAD+ phosphorylase [Kiritimatiellia bacterium]